MAETLAARLIAAREAAGLSQTALARAMGVSRVTVREAELGRDPRASTLMRYRAVLGALLPAELLGAGAHRVPPSLEGAWLLQRDVFGACADLVTRTVAIADDGTVDRVFSTTGLRSVRGKLADPAVRTDVVRMALRGTSAALATRFVASASDLEGRPVVIEDGALRHELVFPRGLARRGLTYVRHEMPVDAAGSLFDVPPTDPAACVALGTCVSVEHPVDWLQLELALAPGAAGSMRPRLMAWAGSLVPEAGERDLADRLHPDGRGVSLVREGDRLVAIVTRPLVGTCYALACTSAPARRRSRRSGVTPGVVLRAGRERAGLSARKLAGLMGVAASTVAEIERGRDVRRSTLQSFLEALPDLSPWELLRADDDATAFSAAEGWSYLRDLFGCEVAEERKVVTLGASGDASMRITTTGLVRGRATPGEFRLRIGYSPPTMRGTATRLRAVQADGDAGSASIRIAPIVGVDGERLHQLIIPPQLASSGVTFARKIDYPGLYVLRAREGRARTGQPGPFHEGSSFAATLPTRRLRLVVRFPDGCWPENPRVHAWPLTQVPDPEAPDLTPRLHPEGLRVEAQRARRTLAVTVERPLPYVKYALSWQLPE